MNRQLFQYHPIIGHQFVPRLRARIDHESGGYLLRTNAAGFRCRHEFTKQRSGRFRVLLFGDSYTAGDGVSDKHRYAELLEHLLPEIEIYNFGLSGSGTDQQYLIWREMARDIEHDLVLIAVLVENIRRVAARYRPYATRDGKQLLLAKPYFSLEPDGSIEIHNVPVPKDPLTSDAFAPDADSVDRGGRFPWLRQAVNRLGEPTKARLQRLTGYQPVPAYDDPENDDWRLMRAILERWLDEIRAPAVVCPVPLYQHIEETASARGYQARFRELHRPPRVHVHDPLTDFQSAPLAERRGYRFEVDCHLSPAGHEVLAGSLARCIEPLMDEASGAR